MSATLTTGTDTGGKSGARPGESAHTLRLRSELPSVERVEHLAEQCARRAGFDPDTAAQVAMVAREATVNAILHGNRSDPTRQVRATVSETATALTVTVADEGAGFDAEAVPDPLHPENLLRSSGRGIFLMRAYMDEVHFRKLPHGQEITLVKYKDIAAQHRRKENA